MAEKINPNDIIVEATNGSRKTTVIINLQKEVRISGGASNFCRGISNEGLVVRTPRWGISTKRSYSFGRGYEDVYVGKKRDTSTAEGGLFMPGRGSIDIYRYTMMESTRDKTKKVTWVRDSVTPTPSQTTRIVDTEHIDMKMRRGDGQQLTQEWTQIMENIAIAAIALRAGGGKRGMRRMLGREAVK